MLTVEMQLVRFQSLPDVLERLDLIREMIADGVRVGGYMDELDRRWSFEVYDDPDKSGSHRSDT